MRAVLEMHAVPTCIAMCEWRRARRARRGARRASRVSGVTHRAEGRRREAARPHLGYGVAGSLELLRRVVGFGELGAREALGAQLERRDARRAQIRYREARQTELAVGKRRRDDDELDRGEAALL